MRIVGEEEKITSREIELVCRVIDIVCNHCSENPVVGWLFKRSRNMVKQWVRNPPPEEREARDQLVLDCIREIKLRLNEHSTP